MTTRPEPTLMFSVVGEIGLRVCCAAALPMSWLIRRTSAGASPFNAPSSVTPINRVPPLLFENATRSAAKESALLTSALNCRLECTVVHYVFEIRFKLLPQAEKTLRKPQDSGFRQFQVMGKSRVDLLGIVSNDNTAIIHLLADQRQEIIGYFAHCVS